MLGRLFESAEGIFVHTTRPRISGHALYTSLWCLWHCGVENQTPCASSDGQEPCGKILLIAFSVFNVFDYKMHIKNRYIYTSICFFLIFFTDFSCPGALTSRPSAPVLLLTLPGHLVMSSGRSPLWSRRNSSFFRLLKKSFEFFWCFGETFLHIFIFDL